MWLISMNAPGVHFRLPFQRAAAGCFALAGVVSSVLGVLEFRRAKTTVNPTKPRSSSSLVASGIYRHTRNPMYLGFLLILFGWAVWLGHVLPFAFLPAFIAYMNFFQIRSEERALGSIFGDDFRTYCSQVRRWI
jgi:protein-S-isoprenylcysteine O-methyltransferase Ste14